MTRSLQRGERPWKNISFLVLDEVGVTLDERGVARIPYLLRDGSVFRERFVAPTGRTWWGPGDGLIPFGLETLPPDSEAEHWACILAEGESGALALREAFAGVIWDPPPAIRGYCVLALPGAGTWRPDWRTYLEPFPLVYLLGDGDSAGREMNARVMRDVPWARPVWLPDGSDARAIVQRHGARALDPLLDRADETARLRAAFIIAEDLAHFEALLAGPEASRHAA